MNEDAYILKFCDLDENGVYWIHDLHAGQRFGFCEKGVVVPIDADIASPLFMDGFMKAVVNHLSIYGYPPIKKYPPVPESFERYISPEGWDFYFEQEFELARKQIAKYLRKSQPLPDNGMTYLMQVVDAFPTMTYKIGRSVNPTERRRALQSEHGVELQILHTIQTPYYGALENALHRVYKHRKVKGIDWFELWPDEVAFIKSLTTEQIEEMVKV